MSTLVNALISGRRQRLLRNLLWAAIYAALLLLGLGFVLWQVATHIDRDQRAELGRIGAIRDAASSALSQLQRDAKAAPCSRDFLAQMQRVAFLADGLNEFLYAPNGDVACSTSQPLFSPPVALGPLDIEASRPGRLSWRIDRDLTVIGRPGSLATIASLGDFAVAIPPYTRYEDESLWLRKQLVARDTQDHVWPVAGDRGFYTSLTNAPRRSWLERLTTVRATACGPQGFYCVASEADLLAWARDWATILSSVAILAALFAWVCANNILAWVQRYWSFEARFERGLDAQSIVLAYQPIIDLRTDEVVGCEVLARWRDVDGRIVSPDQFIGIVARIGRTAAFTRMVIDRAYAELSVRLPSKVRLQVSFNVFACDFDSQTLLPLFADALAEAPRLVPAVELVEQHDIDFEQAQLTIEQLAAAGIHTYIDDFGTGYSSIERAATLAVHGVKLDRSFAMSPPDSVMGRMLVHVVEMIKATGRLIVVEGVETQSRLALLRATGAVDYVQGYVIARPLGIDEFSTFLTRGRTAWAIHPVAAA